MYYYTLWEHRLRPACGVECNSIVCNGKIRPQARTYLLYKVCKQNTRRLMEYILQNTSSVVTLPSHIVKCRLKENVPCTSNTKVTSHGFFIL